MRAKVEPAPPNNAHETATADRQPPLPRLWWGVFTLALAFYAATANHGVQWQDSGWQQLRIVTGDISHPAGLALYHPLHFYLGRCLVRLCPWEPAFSVTLVSCLSAAAALANITVIIRLLTRSAFCAAIPTIALGLSHTFWQHAAHTETYDLGVALLSAEWLCLTLYAQRWRWRYLPMVALFNGLGISTHMLALLATPVDLAVIAWAARKRGRPRLISSSVLAWLAGASLYIALVVSTAIDSGDLAATARSALFGHYGHEVLNTHLGLRGLIFALGYIVYNFPGLTVPLAFIGAWRVDEANSMIRRVLVAELLIYLAFVIRYSIPDQYTYFTPVYAMLAILSGLGLAHARRWPPSRWRRATTAAAVVTACWTPVVYSTTATVLRRLGAFHRLVGNQPYRDGYGSFFLPWGVGDRHVRTFNRDLYRLAGENGYVVLGVTMARFAIDYDRHFGRAPAGLEYAVTRTLLRRYSSREIRELLSKLRDANRVVVQAPYDRDDPVELVPGAVWEREGDLYVLRSLPPAAERGG